MAQQGVPFRHYVVALMLAIAMPLAGLLAWDAYRDYEESKRSAESAVFRSAQLSAIQIAGFLHESEEILRRLSQQPRLRALDRRQCGSLLEAVNGLLKYHANVITRDAAGRLVCTAIQPRGNAAPPAPDGTYLRETLRTGMFTVGKPVRSSITGKWVVALAYPLRDAQEGIAGAVALSLDLAKFHEIADGVARFTGTATRVISGDGIVIASSRENGIPIGHDARHTEIVRKVLTASEGTLHARDGAGSERIYGFTAVPGTGWRVYASTLADDIFAKSRRELSRNILMIAAILALAALLSGLLARKVLKSVGNIASTAAAVAAGSNAARAHPAGPAELKMVALQFNSMLDVLNRTEQRLSGIIESAMDPIIVINERHEIALVNPAVEHMFGYSEADLIGRPLSILIPERYRQAHTTHIRNFAATNAASRAMAQFRVVTGRRASGEEFPIDASISQMERGGQRLFTVILRDITRRIEAEKALRDNYELLDRIFATTHFCIVYLDPAFNFVRVNKAYADACGHPPEYFIGRNHFTLYPGEKVAAIFRQVVATGKPHTAYANPFEFPDHPEWGVTYWDWSLHPVMNEDARVEGLLFALVDVTDRERTGEALRSNEESLRVALTSVDMALFHQNLDLRYEWMYSPQLGYTPEDVVGKSDSELLPPEDASQIIDIKRRVLETGVGARAEVSVTRLNKRNYFDLVVEPLVDAKGQLVGITGASLDITERKRTEYELERKTALAQLLESLARTANEAVAPEDAMRACLTRLCEFGNWAIGRVAMTHELSGDFESSGYSIWHAADFTRYAELIRVSPNVHSFPAGGQLMAVVVREKRPVWISDLTEAPRMLRSEAALAGGLRAAFAFPVIVKNKVVAFLEFFADTPRPVDSTLIEASETIAAQLARLTERRRSEDINARLAAIVENSSDAIVSRGLDRTILTWNAAAERLFGYTAAEVIGRNVSLIIPPDQEARGVQVRALLKEGISVPNYDAVRLAKGGRRIDVSVAASPIKDTSGRTVGASLVFRDISERKRAEVEHAQLAAIVKSSNDAIFSRGADGTILTWNAAAERMFGWSAQEAIGQPISMLLPPERIRPQGTLIDRAPRAEPASPVQTTHVRKDGARIQTQVTFSPVTDQLGNVIAVSNTVRDITELTDKENALRIYATRLRELSQRLQEVEETERHAISRELHDRIGQDLSTLTLLFGRLAAGLSKDSLRKVRKQLEDMQGLLKSTVANVRDVMAELRPPVLDDYGLLAALRHLLTEFAGRSSISVELSGADLDPRLPPIVETAMYRISQEALNNIAKHAQAGKVAISLESASGRVMLSIEDDGIGFDAERAPQDARHWGMVTMRERAESVGILFRLETAPGAGTLIALEAGRAPA